MPIWPNWRNLFRRSLSASALLALVLTTIVGTPAQASTINAYSYAKALATHVWASHSGYSRTQFSSGWGSINGCDLRNIILQRDLRNVVYKSGSSCLVQRGTLTDKYTGKVIYFVRGVSTSLAVQIDHVVALSNAWSTGAQKLSSATRYSIANDPMNLLAVDGPTNSAKGDKDAASFLPPRSAYRCPYVARQLAVKRKYHLWVTAAEKSAMVSVLSHCRTVVLPTK